MLKKTRQTGMGEPVGGALGRDPGHDENDSMPGQGLGANLYLRKALTFQTPVEFTLGDILLFPKVSI